MPDNLNPSRTAADVQAAVTFLLRWAPNGRWLFSAIDPITRDIETRTFSAQTADEAAAWITQHNAAGHGLYYSVNQPRGPMNKKAEKTDIAFALGQHVDIDARPPPEGTTGFKEFEAHYLKEFDRILAALTSYKPTPTEIVFTGGGYQGLWRYRTPYEIDGPEDRDKVEARNKKIAKDLGGDACHNIDRIMRLPGTVNWPTPKKQKAGRKAVRAHVAGDEANRSLLYNVHDFQPFIEPAQGKANGAQRPRRELPDEITDLIANGFDGSKYASDRSRGVLYVCCECARHGWSRDEIKANLLDQSKGISKHVYDQSKPLQYAQRQVDRAFDAVAAEVSPEGSPECSEDALALQVVEQHGWQLRHVTEVGKWFRWDGQCWGKDRTTAIYDLIRPFVREAALQQTTVARQRAAARASIVAGVETLARSDRRITAHLEMFDSDPFLLNTPDGIVNLRTGEIRPCDPLALCSKITAVGPAPPGTPAPLFTRFLAKVTGATDLTNTDAIDLISFLKRMAGSCLTGDTSDQVFFFGHGQGANGKGVFITVLLGVMGDYAISAPAEVFLASKNERHPTELAGLMGARLVVASEIDQGQRWNEARIKALTGGDPITARFMRQDFFTYTPQFKPLIMGNHRPSLRDVGEAMRRRMHLLPFEIVIPKSQRDPDLSKKLKAEWPAILRWAIDGCLEWQRNGLKPPKRVVDATDDYLAGQDVFGQWFADCCKKDVNGWASSTALFKSWRDWATARNEFFGSQKWFSGVLSEKGFRRHHRTAGNGFDGLKLTAPPLDRDEPMGG